MEKVEKFDLESTCRVCLRTITIFQNSSELFEENKTITLGSMIYALSEIPIWKFDGLPQRVCLECHKRVQDSYILRSEFIENDKKLRGSFEPVVSIKEEAMEYEIPMPDMNANANLNYLVTEQIKYEHGVTNPIDLAQEEMKLKKQKKDERDKKKKKTKEGAKRQNEKFRCCMCEYPANTDAQLRLHVNEKHSNVKEQQGKVITSETTKCEYCLRYFKNKRTHRDHFRRPYCRKGFQCLHCGSTFSAKADLKSHEEMHRGIVDTFPCSVCGLSFKKGKNLRRHMKNHDPEESKYQCHYCAQLFAFKSRLELHVKSHLDIRNYPCTICPKRFMTNQLLTIHMRIHTGERPHVCFCGKAYKQKTDLRRHQYEHTDTRPYKCSYCDRAFFQKSNMKVHETTHTGALPFQCSICQQKFRHQANLHLHMKNHNAQQATALKMLPLQNTSKSFEDPH